MRRCSDPTDVLDPSGEADLRRRPPTIGGEGLCRPGKLQKQAGRLRNPLARGGIRGGTTNRQEHISARCGSISGIRNFGWLKSALLVLVFAHGTVGGREYIRSRY